jgi:hypothetical protein
VFSGKFSVRWEDLESVRLELFSPGNRRAQEANDSEVAKLFAAGGMVRLLYVFSPEDDGSRRLQVFANRRQAEKALSAERQRLNAVRQSQNAAREAELNKEQEEFAREARRRAELAELELPYK